jgi:hypothetical protein
MQSAMSSCRLIDVDFRSPSFFYLYVYYSFEGSIVFSSMRTHECTSSRLESMDFQLKNFNKKNLTSEPISAGNSNSN